MLNKFRKPNTQHAKPDVRLAAIEQLESTNDPQAHNTLMQLAKSDPDQAVRTAAIAKLHDLQLVAQLAEHEQDNAVRNTALKRFHELISGQIDNGPSLESRLALIKTTQNIDTLRYIIDHADDESRSVALQNITDESTLADIAINSIAAKARLAAAERVTATDKLQQIAKHSKQKDKGLYQNTQQRLDALEAVSSSKQAEQQHITALCEKIAALADSEVNQQYTSKLKALTVQWESLEDKPSAELIERFKKHQSSCAEKLELHLLGKEKIVCIESLESLHQTLTQQSLEQQSDIDQTGELLTEHQNNWQEITTHTPATTQEQERFTQVETSLQHYLQAIYRVKENEQVLLELFQQASQLAIPDDAEQIDKIKDKLKQHLKTIDWPLKFKRPKLLSDSDQAFDILGQKTEILNEWHKQQRDGLKSLIDELNAALDEGASRNAETLYNKIQDTLQVVSRKDAAKARSRLNKLRPKLQELGNWRRFAENHHQLDLCERMEVLAEKAIHPNEKAKLIKELQQEWKKQSASSSSNSQKLWKRFKAASDKAYAPCQEYFGSQSEQRKNNLAQRQKLCEQLNNFVQAHDWETPDWKAIDKLIRSSRQAWREYTPVDRKPGKAVQEQFDELLNTLNTRLKTELDRNLENKREMVKQAEALIEHASISEATEQAKVLQQQWRDIGLTPHRQNQACWKQFRAACDAIFARLKEERNQQSAAQVEEKQKAEEICAQIETLNKSAGSEISTQRKALGELQNSFKALNLSGKSFQSVRNRFNEACKQFDLQLKKHAAKQKRAIDDALLEKAATCHQLESLAADMPADLDSAITTIKAQWQQDTKIPATIEKQLNARFEHAEQALQNNNAAVITDAWQTNQIAYKELCIRFELLAEIESPAEAQAERMQYQLTMLKEAMTSRTDDTQDKRKQTVALINEWCLIGPADPAEMPGYLQRIKQALAALN